MSNIVYIIIHGQFPNDLRCWWDVNPITLGKAKTLHDGVLVFSDSIYRPVIKNHFPYFSTKTYVVGTQKNCLNEKVLLNTQNKCLN